MAAINSGGPAGCRTAPTTSSGADAVQVQQGGLRGGGQARGGQQRRTPVPMVSQDCGGSPVASAVDRSAPVRPAPADRHAARMTAPASPHQTTDDRPVGAPVSTATTAVSEGTAAASSGAGQQRPGDRAGAATRRSPRSPRSPARSARRPRSTGQARPERQHPQRQIAAGVGNLEAADHQQDGPEEARRRPSAGSSPADRSAARTARPPERTDRRAVRLVSGSGVDAASDGAGAEEGIRTWLVRPTARSQPACEAASTPTTSISRSAASSSQPPAPTVERSGPIGGLDEQFRTGHAGRFR